MNDYQKSVLAFVVVDPDAWYQHSVATFGESIAQQHLQEKVTKYQAEYDEAIKNSEYKTRVERELENQKELP